jgi:hypothetical protein
MTSRSEERPSSFPPHVTTCFLLILLLNSHMACKHYHLVHDHAVDEAQIQGQLQAGLANRQNLVGIAFRADILDTHKTVGLTCWSASCKSWPASEALQAAARMRGSRSSSSSMLDTWKSTADSGTSDRCNGPTLATSAAPHQAMPRPIMRVIHCTMRKMRPRMR